MTKVNTSNEREFAEKLKQNCKPHQRKGKERKKRKKMKRKENEKEKEKTQARTTAIKDKSFQTSCTKA